MALSLVALSEDRPTRRRVAGLGLGFLGVLTVLGAWQGFSGLDFSGTAMALLASLSYPIGWIYVRRTLAGNGSSTLALTGSQLFLGTAQIALVTPLFTSAPDGFPLLPTLAVVALGALGTGLAVLLQYGLVEEVGPTTAQMVTYFIPVIATAAERGRARRATELEHTGGGPRGPGRRRPHPEQGPGRPGCEQQDIQRLSGGGAAAGAGAETGAGAGAGVVGGTETGARVRTITWT